MFLRFLPTAFGACTNHFFHGIRIPLPVLEELPNLKRGRRASHWHLMGRCGEARTFVSTLAMDAMARQHALVISAHCLSRGAPRGATAITRFTLGRWRGVLSLSVVCKMMFDVLGTHAHLGRTPPRVPRRRLTSRHVAACRRARHGAHLPTPRLSHASRPAAATRRAQTRYPPGSARPGFKY